MSRPDAAVGADAGASSEDALGLDDAAQLLDARDPGSMDAAVALPDAAPMFPDAAPIFPDAAPVFPDAAPVFPDAAPIFPDAAPIFPDAAAVFPDASVPRRDAGMVQDAGTPACSRDGDCASGRCHPLYRQCVPVSARAHCGPCVADSECGLPTDHCLDVFDGQSTFLERVCAQGCSADRDCPRGHACTLDGHCYPITGSLRLHTCASLADMMARESCDFLGSADTCGLTNYADGTCVPTIGCTVGCVNDADCPAASSCTFVFIDSYCVPTP